MQKYFYALPIFLLGLNIDLKGSEDSEFVQQYKIAKQIEVQAEKDVAEMYAVYFKKKFMDPCGYRWKHIIFKNGQKACARSLAWTDKKHWSVTVQINEARKIEIKCIAQALEDEVPERCKRTDMNNCAYAFKARVATLLKESTND